MVLGRSVGPGTDHVGWVLSRLSEISSHTCASYVCCLGSAGVGAWPRSIDALRGVTAQRSVSGLPVDSMEAEAMTLGSCGQSPSQGLPTPRSPRRASTVQEQLDSSERLNQQHSKRHTRCSLPGAVTQTALWGRGILKHKPTIRISLNVAENAGGAAEAAQSGASFAPEMADVERLL
eukprot:3254888-Pleurochrysis_carterae.AAC.1